jgi:hypothetical protein
MLLEGQLGKLFIDAVKGHTGHKLEAVIYGRDGDAHNYSVECVDCCTVLIDADVVAEETSNE